MSEWRDMDEGEKAKRLNTAALCLARLVYLKDTMKQQHPELYAAHKEWAWERARLALQATNWEPAWWSEEER